MNDEYVNVVGITFKKYGKKYYFDCHNLNKLLHQALLEYIFLILVLMYH